jgi:hypothetical protein
MRPSRTTAAWPPRGAGSDAASDHVFDVVSKTRTFAVGRFVAPAKPPIT